MFKALFHPGLAWRILPMLLLGLLTTSLVLSWKTEEVLESSILEMTKQKAVNYLLGLEASLQTQQDPLNSHLLRKLIDNTSHHSNKEMGFTVYEVYFFDRKGKILMHSEPGIHRNKKIKGHYARVFDAGEIYLGNKIEYFRSKSGELLPKIDIIVPLHYEGKIIAAMELEVNLKTTMQHIKKLDDQYEQDLILVLAGSAIFMLAYFWLSIRYWLIKPINQLDAMTSRITDGELQARVDIRQRSELGNLGKAVNIMADSIERLFNDQEQAHLQMLQSLARALEAKDSYTASHSGRVSKFSVMLGKRIGLDAEQLTLLKQGALVHDLGKIGIPDHILNKPTALDDSEFEIMRRHPVMTASIMKPLRRFKEFTEIAAWHHERWDGKGYPDGLVGEQIPVLARIVAIADAWDAMTGDRVYRKGMSVEKAISILIDEKMSGQWDPELLQAFIDMIQEEQANRENIRRDMDA